MIFSEVIDNQGLEQFLTGKFPIRFGHLRYEEASKDTLISLGGSVWLHKNAAYSFNAMKNAMIADGVTPIEVANGYRSYKQQEATFELWRVKRQYGTIKTLTRVALPGYSEHHTGFAIDIRIVKGLAKGPFTRSDSYQWLMENSHNFGFYQPFKKDNIFGTMYEPWHWCFRSCNESRQIFSTSNALLKSIDPSDKELLSIIKSPNPLKKQRDKLSEKYPKVLTLLSSHNSSIQLKDT